MELDNIEIINNFSYKAPTRATEYVTYTYHAIGTMDIVFAVGGYVVLCYYWIKINKNKEYWQKWVNPSGREVNVFKTIRILMFVYPIMVVILGILQIMMAPK